MLFTNAHTHNSTESNAEIFNAPIDYQGNDWYSLGVHPWEASLENVNKLQKLLNDQLPNRLVALGEIGLDKLKGPSLEIQTNCFILQLKLAQQHQLPVIIHCVRTWQEISALQRQYYPEGTFVFHGIRKTSLIDDVIKAGWMISVGTYIMHAEQWHQALEHIPIDKLLVETDDSEVAIESLYTFVAERKGLSLPALTDQIKNNFQDTFRRWHIG